MEPSSPLGGRLHHFALHVQAARCARGRRAAMQCRRACLAGPAPCARRRAYLAEPARCACRWAAARPRDRHTRAALGVVDLEARPGPATTHRHRRHRHRDQAPHPAIARAIPAPTPNSARNSPTTISNLEFITLELQRFQTLLKLHPIELHATFLGASPTIRRHRSQALGNSPISSVGIHRSHPQALFPSGSYPQGFVSAWITRCHARSVDVDGPTRGPTKE